MDKLHNNDIIFIEGTDDTPEITMDSKTMRIRIKGPSFPEDAIDFYTPVIIWVKNLGQNFENELICELDFSILSSASNKMIFEMLLLFENLIKNKNRILVKWYYENFDEDMFDEGKGFRDSMKVPFELIEK